MIKVYALALESPGRYIVGHCKTPIGKIVSSGSIRLTDAAHLTVLKDQSILTPIDVLGVFVANTAGYLGFGVLNPGFTTMYENWLEVRRNPPDFEVQESE